MSLYIIEDRYGALRDSSVNYNYAKSLQQSRYPDCHIVELVPAKPKVQVSHEEADMLEKAKHNPTLRPSFMITEYSNSHKGNILGNHLEDRLMRAYVNGWKVEKPKRYVLPMPSGNPDEKSMRFAKKLGPQNWQPSEYRHTVGEVSGLVSFLVTQSDIDAAPNWVKAITPVEVTDDEQ